MENLNQRLCFPKKQFIETSTLYYLSAKEVLSNISGNNKYNRSSTKKDGTVQKFKKMMLRGEWYFRLTVITVLLNDLSVVNGWHRLIAIKTAMEEDPTFNPEIYVRFIRAKDDKEIQDIIQIENGRDAREWNVHDHCQTWVENENPAFCHLYSLCTDEKYPKLHMKNGKPMWGKGAMLLGISQTDFKKVYVSGDWTISEEDKIAAPKRYYQVVQLIDAFGLPDGNDSWLYITQAWIDLNKNDEEFKRDFNRLPGGIDTLLNVIRTLAHEYRLPSNKIEEWRDRLVDAMSKAKRRK